MFPFAGTSHDILQVAWTLRLVGVSGHLWRNLERGTNQSSINAAYIYIYILRATDGLIVISHMSPGEANDAGSG